MHEKQKSGLIMSDKSKNMPFFAKPIFSHSYANSSKTSPKKRIGEKCGFFSLFAGCHQRVNKVTDLF